MVFFGMQKKTLRGKRHRTNSLPILNPNNEYEKRKHKK
jgi:hypothetical protein